MIPLPRRTPDPTDTALISRAQAGDGAAFILLYDRHLTAVWKVVAATAVSERECQDLVSKTMFTAVERINHAAVPYVDWLAEIAAELGAGVLTAEDRFDIEMDARYEARRSD